MVNIKNKTLYSIKVLACLCVIIIHSGYSGLFGKIMCMISRWAVPFFFMTSGYFSYFKDGSDVKQIINKRLIKLAKITILSSTFYFILNFFIVLKSFMVSEYILQVSSIKSIFELIILNYSTPLIGAPHIWYLLAMIYVYELYKIVDKHNIYKLSYCYSILCIIMVYFFEIINIHNDLNISTIWWRNFLFFGFPFFMLGNLLHKYEDKFKMNNKKLAVTLIILIFTIISISLLELFKIDGNMELYFNSILISILIFILAINNTNIEFGSEIGRLDSGNIYIIHYAIIIASRYVKNEVTTSHIYKLFFPLIVFLVSLLISFLYRKIKQYNFKKLINNNKIV